MSSVSGLSINDVAMLETPSVRKRFSVLMTCCFLPVAMAGLMADAAAQNQLQDKIQNKPQEQTVHRKEKGQSGKDIRIGVFLNVLPDCSSGTLPSIRMVTPPSSGTAVVKRAKITLTNYKNCMALEAPAFVAIYRSRPAFVGTDAVTLTVSYLNGRTETQTIEISVSAGPAGRNI